MSPLRPDISWPYTARIWDRTDAEGRCLIILRGVHGGIEIDRLIGSDLRPPRLLSGRQIYILALGMPGHPDFTGGPGLPLFDYLMRDLAGPISAFLDGEQPRHIDRIHVDRMMALLQDAVLNSEVGVVSKPWPLVPGSDYRSLRADELSTLQFNVATNFACPRFNPGTVGWCDLRVTPPPRRAADAETSSGRPVQYNWDQFQSELQRITKEGSGVADLLEPMKRWCQKRVSRGVWSKVPGDSTLRAKIRQHLSK